MNIQDVFQLIRQGQKSGEDIRSFFITEDIRENTHMSKVTSYNYENKFITIKLDITKIEEHKKDLKNKLKCELLIKKGNADKSISIKLFCEFLSGENEFVFVKTSSIKYIGADHKIESFDI
ncbi:MAG: hypothetical protein WCI41_03660 [bacterium]